MAGPWVRCIRAFGETENQEVLYMGKKTSPLAAGRRDGRLSRLKSAFKKQWQFYTMMIPGLLLIVLLCFRTPAGYYSGL